MRLVRAAVVFSFLALAVTAAVPAAGDSTAWPAHAEPARFEPDAVRAALAGKEQATVALSPMLDLNDGRTVVAWSQCSHKGCHGFIGLLTGSPQHPRLARMRVLAAPPRVFFDDGFSFEMPGLEDFDGDGVSEIVLRYDAAEPPRCALGSVRHEYIAAYSVQDLAPVFSHELRRAGALSEMACQWTLARGGGGGEILLAQGLCNERACLESPTESPLCKPSRKLIEKWHRPSGQKAYIPVDNATRRAALRPLRERGEASTVTCH